MIQVMNVLKNAQPELYRTVKSDVGKEMGELVWYIEISHFC